MAMAVLAFEASCLGAQGLDALADRSPVVGADPFVVRRDIPAFNRSLAERDAAKDSRHQTTLALSRISPQVMTTNALPRSRREADSGSTIQRFHGW